ncbi:trypsin-like peptidase domain-containing protein [Lysobacter antibioticus]|nr:trypsin-like peptidase domain-containing protein [Lysobacter antibioticus]
MFIQPSTRVVAEPSYKSLFLELRFNGQRLSTATGFVVNAPRGPVLITNRHNFTGRHQETGAALSRTGGLPNEVAIQHNGNFLGIWREKLEPLFAGDTPLWIEHPILGAKADFVALPLTNIRRTRQFPYELGNQNPNIAVGPGEVISVVGFPFGRAASGYFAIWATGFVASDPDLDYNNLPAFLIDCRSRVGQSGSAVIADRAGGAVTQENGMVYISNRPATRFLGVYSGRINAQSDLGFVWKASAVAELISTIC